MFIDKEREIKIMGIVNLTDDSYYACSRCACVESARKKIDTMLEEGADIIDIGACSTRPGSFPVDACEEWRRLEPVLEEISLREAMKKLGDREKHIINLRFYKGRTQMEVAKELGISQAQVSRLEKSALSHMKKNM